MYSGTTLRNTSGRLMGVHQKIDRVARKQIAALLPTGVVFPETKDILHFEGKNGPDGIKHKSPSVDEPWHFIDPADIEHSPLITVIEQHLENLVNALAVDNIERAAFEAAWLSHAITDGLTPAHHYPLEERLRQLRQGEGNETRTSVLKKGLMKGDTKVEALKNNWHYWGAKGAMTTHMAFEAGIASVVPYQRFTAATPTPAQLADVLEKGFVPVFCDAVRLVDELKMYDKFQKTGWTTTLAKQTNQLLMPTIIHTVALAWLCAAEEAQGQHGTR